MTDQFKSASFVLVVLGTAAVVVAQQAKIPPVEAAKLGEMPDVHVCGGLYLAGQPTADDLPAIRAADIQRVISLRPKEEVAWKEAEAIKDAGIEFIEVPFRQPESLTDEVFDKVRRMLDESEKVRTLVHCSSANRVGAVWLTRRVLDDGVPLQRAIEEAKEVGLSSTAYLDKAKDYIKRKTEDRDKRDQNGRPGR